MSVLEPEHTLLEWQVQCFSCGCINLRDVEPVFSEVWYIEYFLYWGKFDLWGLMVCIHISRDTDSWLYFGYSFLSVPHLSLESLRLCPSLSQTLLLLIYMLDFLVCVCVCVAGGRVLAESVSKIHVEVYLREKIF